jgi:glycosyltransferase involved in cell wall biosynthesis
LPDRFLLFVGTLEPRKNLPMLLRAYAALPARDREACHLVLAGGRGWMVDEIDHVIEQHDLAATVHLPGYVSDDELHWWYNAAEALVYPSVFEGWGIPVIEAMACGKPALVSDVSSLPEAVGERCISDAAWRSEQGEQAHRRAERFTWLRTAEQTVNSYRKALHPSTVVDLVESTTKTKSEEIFEHTGEIEHHA